MVNEAYMHMRSYQFEQVLGAGTAPVWVRRAAFEKHALGVSRQTLCRITRAVVTVFEFATRTVVRYVLNGTPQNH